MGARTVNTHAGRCAPRLGLAGLCLGAGLAWPQLPPPLLEVPHAAPISLQFHNTEVRALMQVFAEFTGLNFVTTDSVGGQVSVRLQDVPWTQALQIVLQAKGLVARQDGRVVWVAPQDEWLQREKKRLEAQAALEQVSPLQVQAWRLRYARASEVAQRLQGGAVSGGTAAHWISPRGSVMAEPRTNQLFVSDVPTRLAEVGKIVERLDVPVRQVLIEARIVEADDQFGQALGVRLGLGASRTVSLGGASASLGQLGASNLPTGPGVATGNQVRLPAGDAGQKLVLPASLAVSIFNASADRFINLELSALEADGRGKVISRPRVITADQTKALIEQGTELP
ncbi:MAG: type IV pilus secretin PilQ, partial [Betaproteobacteria bacterium]|nr:type IV pilus secretin PilQ [Betaproteobacteria bacterium]